MKSPPTDAAAGMRGWSEDQNARFKEGLVIVDIVARKLYAMFARVVELEELVSAGRATLVEVVRDYDPAQGSFRNYTNVRVRGAMIDMMRYGATLPRTIYRMVRAAEAANNMRQATLEEDDAPRPASAEEADARLGDYLGKIATATALGYLRMNDEDPTENAESLLARQETLAQVRTAMEALPEVERKIVQRHYFEDAQLDTVAGEIGVSKSWASRLHARAIEGIAKELKKTRR